jgi:hypothetical protein
VNHLGQSCGRWVFVFADNRNLSAEALRREQKGFFDGDAPKAHQVLNDIPEKYIDDGVAQFQIPEKLKAPPISDHGTVMEIAALFSGAEKLRTAVSEMQALLYSPQNLREAPWECGSSSYRLEAMNEIPNKALTTETQRHRELKRKGLSSVPRRLSG